jgi:ABC-type sugar transport system substrate-binding protein
MWRSKKFIIVVVMAILVLGITLGGVVIAHADDENANTTTTDSITSFIEKVAEIYQANTGVAIDPQQLQQAITEARQAIRDEALDNYLQKLVNDGTITQDQADEFKAWLDAKPSLDVFKTWLESHPDIPALFGQNDENGIGPFGHPRGMFKFGDGPGGKFFGGCIPDEDTD